MIYLTPRQLVERWGGAIALGTLSNWRSKGKGPCFTKLGTRVVYPLASVEAWERLNEGSEK